MEAPGYSAWGHLRATLLRVWSCAGGKGGAKPGRVSAHGWVGREIRSTPGTATGIYPDLRAEEIRYAHYESPALT